MAVGLLRTARNGEPLALYGVVLEEFDDAGLYEALRVSCPMSDDEVGAAFNQGNRAAGR